MDRLFLDANILFSAAYREGARLVRFWHLRRIELYSSGYAIAEARFNLETTEQQRRLVDLVDVLVVVDAGARSLPEGIELPGKDAPILLAAIQAGATHLITGDLRHFGPYFGRRIEGVRVVTPAQYFADRH